MELQQINLKSLDFNLFFAEKRVRTNKASFIDVELNLFYVSNSITGCNKCLIDSWEQKFKAGF